MAQLSDDCFAFGGALMTMDEALSRLRSQIDVVTGTETVGLAEADGRVLAADVAAANGMPPADNSAVDGYAVRHDDLSGAGPTRLAVTGRAAAGRPLQGAWRQGGAIRIFTGAVLPDGCDSVVMQEDVIVHEQGDTEEVEIPPGLKRGANRRRAGEDFTAGSPLLRHGHRLRPQDLGLLAAGGRPRVDVRTPLRVALFSTGDELREPGTPLSPGAINDANRHMLRALIRRLGCRVADLGILPDRFAPVRDAIAAAAADHDLIVTSGGVSTGDEDHVRAAIESLGAIHTWRLAIKPGRPIALGQVGRVPFLGLPGNPVAAMVCFIYFGRPLIAGLAGETAADPRTYRVRMGFRHASKGGRREWLRGLLERTPDGVVTVQRFRSQGSGILSSMVESDGLIVVPEAIESLEEGDMVEFLPFAEVL